MDMDLSAYSSMADSVKELVQNGSAVATALTDLKNLAHVPEDSPDALPILPLLNAVDAVTKKLGQVGPLLSENHELLKAPLLEFLLDILWRVKLIQDNVREFARNRREDEVDDIKKALNGRKVRALMDEVQALEKLLSLVGDIVQLAAEIRSRGEKKQQLIDAILEILDQRTDMIVSLQEIPVFPDGENFPIPNDEEHLKHMACWIAVALSVPSIPLFAETPDRQNNQLIPRRHFRNVAALKDVSRSQPLSSEARDETRFKAEGVDLDILKALKIEYGFAEAGEETVDEVDKVIVIPRALSPYESNMITGLSAMMKSLPTKTTQPLTMPFTSLPEFHVLERLMAGWTTIAPEELDGTAVPTVPEASDMHGESEESRKQSKKQNSFESDKGADDKEEDDSWDPWDPWGLSAMKKGKKWKGKKKKKKYATRKERTAVEDDAEIEQKAKDDENDKDKPKEPQKEKPPRTTLITIHHNPNSDDDSVEPVIVTKREKTKPPISRPSTTPALPPPHRPWSSGLFTDSLPPPPPWLRPPTEAADRPAEERRESRPERQENRQGEERRRRSTQRETPSEDSESASARDEPRHPRRPQPGPFRRGSPAITGDAYPAYPSYPPYSSYPPYQGGGYRPTPYGYASYQHPPYQNTNSPMPMPAGPAPAYPPVPADYDYMDPRPPNAPDHYGGAVPPQAFNPGHTPYPEEQNQNWNPFERRRPGRPELPPIDRKGFLGAPHTQPYDDGRVELPEGIVMQAVDPTTSQSFHNRRMRDRFRTRDTDYPRFRPVPAREEQLNQQGKYGRTDYYVGKEPLMTPASSAGGEPLRHDKTDQVYDRYPREQGPRKEDTLYDEATANDGSKAVQLATQKPYDVPDSMKLSWEKLHDDTLRHIVDEAKSDLQRQHDMYIYQLKYLRKSPPSKNDPSDDHDDQTAENHHDDDSSVRIIHNPTLDPWRHGACHPTTTADLERMRSEIRAEVRDEVVAEVRAEEMAGRERAREEARRFMEIRGRGVEEFLEGFETDEEEGEEESEDEDDSEETIAVGRVRWGHEGRDGVKESNGARGLGRGMGFGSFSSTDTRVGDGGEKVHYSRPWLGVDDLTVGKGAALPIYVRGNALGQTRYCGSQVIEVIELSPNYRVWEDVEDSPTDTDTDTPTEDNADSGIMSRSEYLAVDKSWIDIEALERSGTKYLVPSSSSWIFLDPSLSAQTILSLAQTSTSLRDLDLIGTLTNRLPDSPLLTPGTLPAPPPASYWHEHRPKKVPLSNLWGGFAHWSLALGAGIVRAAWGVVTMI